MRILHLVNTADAVGNGITNVAVDLVVSQAEAGHQVTIASRPGDLWRLTDTAGARHATVDFTRRGPGLLATAVRLRRLLRTFQPDIVHCHTIVPTALARICAVGTRARVVATVHNEYQNGVQLMRAAHHLFGVSEAVTAAMVRRGRAAHRISTVLNGPVGSKRLAAEFDRVDLGPAAIVFCGGLTHRKGVDVLLAAFGAIAPRLPKTRLVLVGSTDWDEVPALIEATGAADRVERTGFQADPRPWISAAAVFVLPSRHDPMPLVIPEAMALGVAVVGSDADGIPETLEHGRAGVVVPAGDAQALATALTAILTDVSAAEGYAARALERSSHYRVERLSADYESEYRRILSRRR